MNEFSKKEVTSSQLRSLYQSRDRDESVFELKDYPGIQIVRRYSSRESYLHDKRMFINLALRGGEDAWVAVGGVDMVVKGPDHEQLGWSIVDPVGSIFSKKTNFTFREDEEVRFDTESGLFTFHGRSYELNNFIDLLEKNHLSDLFWRSRLAAFLKLSFLRILFWLSDSKYQGEKYIFSESFFYPKNEVSQNQEVKVPDPIFHTFRINKNVLLTVSSVLLVPLFLISTCLSPDYFTVANPVLLVSTLLFFLLLEKISAALGQWSSNKEFIRRVTLSSIELKGSLKR